MSWRVTDVEAERRNLVKAWLSRRYTVVELAQAYGISERVAHKTLRRFREGGWEALADRSRARLNQTCTPADIATALIEARRKNPTWGPRKLRNALRGKQPDVAWPAISTVGSILKRHGLVEDRRRRRARAVPSAPCVEATAPNVSWSMDFKGHFRLGTGDWCYPLTVTDNASRFILKCKALDGPFLKGTWRELVNCFHEHGLPMSIRSDNGSPFGGHGLTRTSTIMVRLIKLGVTPDYIQPGKPQQNARHERMHRTLKHETASPPAATKAAQQRRFNSFVAKFNNERPHEALNDETPSSVHRRSAREMPSRLPDAEYDEGTITRSVRQNGAFKWDAEEFYLAEPLIGERVAFDPIDDGIYLVRFLTYPLAVFDARTRKLHPAGTTPKADLCDRSKG